MTTRLIQGHRGSSEQYPENTMLSYRMALAAGAGGIEADVRRTRDGVFVLCHDPTLERTTGVRTAIAQCDWAAIAGLDASYRTRFGAAFAGHPECGVPSLETLLDTFGDRQTVLVLHLKALTAADWLPLVELVRQHGMIQRCHFFGPLAAIDTIKLHQPDCFTLNDGMPGLDRYREALENAVVRGHDAVSVSALLPEADLRRMVADIHAAGKAAHASYLSADYDARTQMLIDAGVDFVLGNDVARMMAVFCRNGLTQTTVPQR